MSLFVSLARSILLMTLDYFFVSEHLLNFSHKINILPGVHSDHSLLQAHFQSGNTSVKGKGFWKFNASLLGDREYVDQIKKIISDSSNK